MNFLQNDTPLRTTSQNMSLKQKLITVHSYDRDIKKWPNANNFEIRLPNPVSNIHSMRLAAISLPNNQYVFSNEYQNTKLSFKVADVSHNIEIAEGFYTPEQLANELENKMNKTDSSGFEVKYNPVSNKIMFGKTDGSFNLLFGPEQETYTLSCGQKNVWNNYIRWGLGAYLGFEKGTYKSADGSFNAINLDDNDIMTFPSSGSHCIIPPHNLDVFGEDVIYMEIDKCNTIDELEPYSENTSGLYNNDYRTKTNSAFAKIPCVASPFSELHDSTGGGFIKNWVIFDPYIDTLSKLKFKFRYHDGRLVDFKNLPFSFSLELNVLSDAQMAQLRRLSEADFAYINNKTRR